MSFGRHGQMRLRRYFVRAHDCPNCGTRLRVAAVEYIPTKGRWGVCSCNACGVSLRLGNLSRAGVVLLAMAALLASIAVTSTCFLAIADRFCAGLSGRVLLIGKLFCFGFAFGCFFLMQPVVGSFAAKWVVVSKPLRPRRRS